MNKKIKILIYSLASIVFLAIIWLVITNLPVSEETAVPVNNTNEESNNEELFVVSGEFVCLPLIDENKPHNDICLFALKDNDNYYRLQSVDDKNNVMSRINRGQMIEITGRLIEEESDVYQTLGTIKVSGVRYLYTEASEIESYLPNSFKADYISFQNYSLGIFSVAEYPRLEFWIENGEIECDETNLESSLPLRISQKELNGHKYCMAAFSEGAAGSVYTEYAYSTVIDNNVYSVQFVARYPSCSNYPTEEKLQCERERESFDLDNLVSQVIEEVSV
jgi:hypothetical protein